MNWTQPEIGEWIPHGPTMQMIDRIEITDASGLTAITCAHHREGNPLRDRDGHLPISAGVEIAAQAMAMHGVASRKDTKRVSRLAYLVLVRDLTWTRERLDDLEEALIIEVSHLSDDPAGALYNFTIATLATGVLMQGRLGVMYQEARP